MENSADPDQLASSEASLSRSTLFSKGDMHQGSAGQVLNHTNLFILYNETHS